MATFLVSKTTLAGILGQDFMMKNIRSKKDLESLEQRTKDGNIIGCLSGEETSHIYRVVVKMKVDSQSKVI